MTVTSQLPPKSSPCPPASPGASGEGCMCWAHPGHPSSAAGTWLMLRAEFKTIPSGDSAESGRTQVRLTVMDGWLLTALTNASCPMYRCKIASEKAGGLPSHGTRRGQERQRLPQEP